MMDQISNEKVGQFIACLRREQQLTQRQLAERLYVSDKAVSKWERGESLPSVALLMPLARCLGVSVNELLNGSREPAQQLSGTVRTASAVAGGSASGSRLAYRCRFGPPVCARVRQ